MLKYATPALAAAALVAAIAAPKLIAQAQAFQTKGVANLATNLADVDPTAGVASFTSHDDANVAAPGEPGLVVTLDRDTAMPGGLVRAEVVLTAPEGSDDLISRPTDLVLVLDRSGSMSGDKLQTAKRAALQLMAQLGPSDQVSVVAFGSEAVELVPLQPVTIGARDQIGRLGTAGGTNMVAGLDRALDVVRQRETRGRAARLILLSDGHPNTREGLTQLARQAAQLETPLTTVGIGTGYDPNLLQQIADSGTGNSYYAGPETSLASVFAEEFRSARGRVVASSTLGYTGPLEVVDWGGLPTTAKGDQVATGAMFSGQVQSFWITMRVPQGTDVSTMEVGRFSLDWKPVEGEAATFAALPGTLDVTSNQAVAMAGMDKDQWAKGVVVEDYNRMMNEVSQDLADGNQQEALNKLSQYQAANNELNAVVGSAAVSDNLAEVQRFEQKVRARKVNRGDILELSTKSYQGRRSGKSSIY